jgi:hypothetical protein
LRAEDGTQIIDDSEKAEVFSSFFSSLYIKQNLQNILNNRIEKAIEELSTIEVGKLEVTELFMKMQPGEYPGPDGIHPRVLKEYVE